MITKKIFQVGLDISRIDLLARPDANFMNILVDRFEGYCYKSCYVKKILRIIKRSECVVSQNDLDAHSGASITFEAEVEVLLPGEVINGCKVEKKNAHGVMICTRDNLVAGIMPNPLFDSVAEGQLISIRIIGCKYQIGQPRITAQAVPYMYQNGTIFHLTDALTPEDIEYLAPALENAREEETKLGEINAASAKAFGNLLHAYAKPQKPPTGAKEVKITDTKALSGLTNIYVVRDNRADLATPTAYVYTNDTDVQKAYPGVEVNTLTAARGIALNLIHDYINHIRTIREMATIYNTPALFESHKNLWKIFKKTKLS